MMNTGAARLRFFVSGRPVELWEDPDVRFSWSPGALARYAARAEWVLLFNALVQSGGSGVDQAAHGN